MTYELKFLTYGEWCMIFFFGSFTCHFLLRRKRRIVCGMCMFVVLALVRHYDNGLIFHVENAASSVTVFFLGTFPPCDLLAYRTALAGGHKGGISTCPSAGKKIVHPQPSPFFFWVGFFLVWKPSGTKQICTTLFVGSGFEKIIRPKMDYRGVGCKRDCAPLGYFLENGI